ncbi:MAG: type II toxin-antitoxin system HicB family antitoxin [Spirochaetia bacterium]|nr:type II toxin-antitoxin system HicB family antitoxin [Spirochaetia bacterium]
MKNKASVLTIRVPSELKQKIERVAEEQGVSINQLALYVFTKEIQEIEISDYFLQYRNKIPKTKILKDFDAVMKKVKSKNVPDWDKMSSVKKK